MHRELTAIITGFGILTGSLYATDTFAAKRSKRIKPAKVCSAYVKAGHERPFVFDGKKPPKYFRNNPSIEDAFCDAYYHLAMIDSYVDARVVGDHSVEIENFMKGGSGAESLFVQDVPEGRFMYWNDADHTTVIFRRRHEVKTLKGHVLRARIFDSLNMAVGSMDAKILENAFKKAKHEERVHVDPFPYQSVLWLYEPEDEYVPEKYHMPPLDFSDINPLSAEHSFPGEEGGSDDPFKKAREEFRNKTKK